MDDPILNDDVMGMFPGATITDIKEPKRK